MEPVALDIRLIRALLGPTAQLHPGRTVMARVLRADANGHGALSIAGQSVEAELPKGVQAGQDLRLVVRSVGHERVELGLAVHAPPPPPPVPLPGGGNVQVDEREAHGGGGGGPGVHVVSLRYDAPALGPLDLRFELDSGALRVSVKTSPGDTLARAREGVDALTRALSAGVDRPKVDVTVSARREPLDLYA